jgi:hypothetical protein
MILLNCVLVFASLVSHGGGSGMLALKKENGHALLVVCNLCIELLNKIYSESLLGHGLGFGVWPLCGN